MANYNFTVRATDNLGAYADRSFSLEVNNTDISRFVCVGNSGLIHSTNGSAWNAEAGLSGVGVTFGNGNWIVWDGLTSNVLRKSPDAVSWESTVSTFTGTPGNYFHTNAEAVTGGLASAVTSTGFSMIKWVGDRFIGMARAAWNSSGSTAYAALEYHSTDAINWTYARVVHNSIAVGSNQGALGVTDFAYDEATDTWVAGVMHTTGQQMVKYRVGNGAWTVSNIASTNVHTSTGATIINVNGLWMANIRASSINGASYPILTSVDGINWIARGTGQAREPFGLTYANGRVITLGETGASTSSYLSRSTLDGGRTWTTLSSTMSNGSSSVPATNWSQNLAYYSGNMIWVAGGATSWVKRSTDDGASFSNVSITAANLGIPRAVFARQS